MERTDYLLVSKLLELAADVFSNHGCNDFDLRCVPMLPEFERRLVKALDAFNGWDEMEHRRIVGDAELMRYYAEKFRRLALETE